ncbi:sugar transferase [Cryomorphaceae bacterium]|nr:sugar transferase [Cryomorphaceae bacterium]
MPTITYVGEDQGTIDAFQAIDGVEVQVVKNALLLVHTIESGALTTDLVIAERALTGMNGEEAFAKVKKNLRSKGIPYVLLDERFSQDARARLIRAGIDDVYRRPIDPQKIVDRIPFWTQMMEFKKSGKSNFSAKYEYRKISPSKRVFDILVAGGALLVLSPLLIAVAIAIRLESKGPIYYISKRVGTGYKVFDFYKLRSMYMDADKRLKDMKHLNQYSNKYTAENREQQAALNHDTEESTTLFQDTGSVSEGEYLKKKAEEGGSAFVKIANDPRITKVGGFIRNTSIDELPQLINVLKGDMSIVGNRPLPLYEAELLTDDDWSERFLAPAGITGLWQVEKRGKGGK